MSNNFNLYDIFTFESNLTQNILWQYENAESLKSLITQKNNWYQTNVNDFWQYIVDNFLNIQTANDWGLNLWGKILKVKRTYNVNGQITTLSTEFYRTVILGKLQLLRSNGTVPEINNYLNFIFKSHIPENGTYAALVRDNYDMTVYYILNFEPSDEELALIYSREFLPTPAGVQDTIYILDQTQIFGFYGTGFMPFNTAPFWDGRYI